MKASSKLLLYLVNIAVCGTFRRSDFGINGLTDFIEISQNILLEQFGIKNDRISNEVSDCTFLIHRPIIALLQ